MTDFVPPSDIDAENSVLGAMLLSSDAIERVQRILTPADFYVPSNICIYDAILLLWNDGKKVDAVTVADVLRSDGTLDRIGGSAALVSLMASTPAISSAGRYAEIIANKSMYRQAIRVAGDIRQTAVSQSMDPSALIDEAVRQLKAAQVSLGDMPSSVWRIDDFIDQPPEDTPGWIIKDVIRKGWRVMLVASEGSGKTVLFRQIAICTAQGIHPFLHTPMPPRRTLIVDCENPQDSIVDVCHPIRQEAMRRVGDDYDADRAWLWWQPQGINLRNRSDRIRLETVIQNVNPDLVAIGPVYKVYQVAAHENDELAAREVMSTLDDLRTRYGFGLMLEHHAPKGTGGKRDMMPYGTSLWLRWPELGISMEPVDGPGGDMTHMKVGRWRGDRLRNDWPIELHHSDIWPWEGIYETGTHMSTPSRATPQDFSDPAASEHDSASTDEQIRLLQSTVEDNGVVRGYGPRDEPF